MVMSFFQSQSQGCDHMLYIGKLTSDCSTAVSLSIYTEYATDIKKIIKSLRAKKEKTTHFWFLELGSTAPVEPKRQGTDPIIIVFSCPGSCTWSLFPCSGREALQLLEQLMQLKQLPIFCHMGLAQALISLVYSTDILE